MVGVVVVAVVAGGGTALTPTAKALHAELGVPRTVRIGESLPFFREFDRERRGLAGAEHLRRLPAIMKLCVILPFVDDFSDHCTRGQCASRG